MTSNCVNVEFQYDPVHYNDLYEISNYGWNFTPLTRNDPFEDSSGITFPGKTEYKKTTDNLLLKGVNRYLN